MHFPPVFGVSLHGLFLYIHACGFFCVCVRAYLFWVSRRLKIASAVEIERDLLLSEKGKHHILRYSEMGACLYWLHCIRMSFSL